MFDRLRMRTAGHAGSQNLTYPLRSSIVRYCLNLVVLWLLFYVNVLPLPESMLPYAIGGIIVAPAMVMLIESLVLSGSNTRWSTETED